MAPLSRACRRCPEPDRSTVPARGTSGRRGGACPRSPWCFRVAGGDTPRPYVAAIVGRRWGISPPSPPTGGLRARVRDKDAPVRAPRAVLATTAGGILASIDRRQTDEGVR